MEEFARQIDAFERRRDLIVDLIDSLITDVKHLTKSLTKVARSLQQIPTDFPKVNPARVASLVKRTAKGIIVKDTEVLTTLWGQLSTSYFAVPPGLNEIISSLTATCQNQLMNAKTTYVALFQQISAKYDHIVAIEKEEADKEAKARQKYMSLCAKIEDARKRQDYEKLGELKHKYIEVCKQTEECRVALNHARIDFSTNVQCVLSDMELAETSLVDDLNDILRRFARGFEAGAAAQRKGQVEFEQTLKSSSALSLKDMASFFNDNDCSPVATGYEKAIEYSPEHLPFDIFQFLPPRALFEDELKKWGAMIKTQVTSQKTKVTLQKGVIVIVHDEDKKSGKIACEVVSTGQKIILTKNVVEPVPSMKRQLFRLIEDHEDKKTNFKVSRGEYVVGINHTGDMWFCQDAYYMGGHIPTTKLFPC